MGILENTEWLRDFYARYEEDENALHSVERTWAVCKKCPDGYCCGKNSFISLKRRSNPFILEDWWMMLEQVRDNFSREQKKILAKNIISSREACIFLFNNRCSVYRSRPWGSRIHPYTINFYENKISFPTGKIALPSCPSLATAFGLKTDEELIQAPQLLNKSGGNNLVQVKLRKHKPVWLLDISTYLEEYERRSNGRQVSTSELEQLLELATQSGGDYGDLLRIYLEMVLGLRPNIRLEPA
jgi:Fe-S-cluster containining protein